ncbi:Gldg family protein [Pedobacter sp. MC2016-05]|uniref:Gldg family protein n=1 Tax=Pedobacter sp. MC2016-05 TaxID=2994474 RepID=UPI002247D6E3|nr:Gldg family protein [Pedobacter sp. MC2016-05]MCX2475354.1 Gldg family protein [Pedobacter sp. MC2016-05]
MKTIFQIAKTELKMLFYSPIAWFLIIVFMVQCGLGYMATLKSIAQMQADGYKIPFSVVGQALFGSNGLFSAIMRNLYLYLPLLTMGLISKEMSSGTIKLLYSSPIRIRDIVLGKFSAMVFMSAIMLGVVTVFLAISYFTADSPDTGMLLSALLGLFLLLCAYSAIGLFMSSLTTYQIVAAVSTFVIFAILYNVADLWKGVPFIRDITYFLSVSGRTDWMLVGLITSNGIIYFLAIIFLFLTLTIYKLKFSMQTVSPMVKAGHYLSIIAITLLFGYLSAIPQLIIYADVTENKSNTLKPDTQKIIQELGDEPLEITGYTNLFGNYQEDGNPESYQKNINAWAPYVRFKHNIILKSVMYYDTLAQGGEVMRGNKGKTLAQVAEQIAQTKEMNIKNFLTPEQIRKQVDLSKEPNFYIMQLKYKDRKTFLRVYPDNEHWPSETEISAAFKRLLKAKMPKILFANGELERNINKIGDREYQALTNLKIFRQSLLNQGFDVDTISLSTTPVPNDISVLVVADPKVALTISAIKNLQDYIDGGGNLLFTGEPSKQDVLNPIIRQFGVQLMDGAIVQQSKQLEPDLATPNLTGAATKLFIPLEREHKDSVVVSMPLATALSIENIKGFQAQPLLVTNPKSSWLKRERFLNDSAAVKFEPEKGDLQRSFPLATSLTRKFNQKEQRIIIIGDADLMSNKELNRFNLRTANFAFNIGVFSWLSYGEFPISSFRPAPKDTVLLVDKDQIHLLKLIFVWIIPGLLLACGTILLLRRKRK